MVARPLLDTPRCPPHPGPARPALAWPDPLWICWIRPAQSSQARERLAWPRPFSEDTTRILGQLTLFGVVPEIESRQLHSLLRAHCGSNTVLSATFVECSLTHNAFGENIQYATRDYGDGT